MISLDGKNNISISQGDTLVLRFELSEALKQGDVAKLSIREKYKDVLLEASIEGDNQKSLDFVISAEEMSTIPCGKYVYDLSISFSNGIRFTTEWVKEFNVMPIAHDI